MGKVRKLRKKFNEACKKSETTKLSSTKEVLVEKPILGRKDVPDAVSSIFKRVNVSSGSKKPTSNTSIVGSVNNAIVVASQVSKDSGVQHIPKKVKRLARREALRNKMSSASTVKSLRRGKLKADRTTRKKKTLMVIESLNSLTNGLPKISSSKRDKTPKIVQPMLMKSLIEALPTIPSENKSNVPRVKPCLRKKDHKRDFLKNIKAYETVLSNTHYKADPASAISNYVLRTVAQRSK